MQRSWSTLKVGACTLLGAVAPSQPSWEEGLNNITTVIVIVIVARSAMSLSAAPSSSQFWALMPPFKAPGGIV